MTEWHWGDPIVLAPPVYDDTTLEVMFVKELRRKYCWFNIVPPFNGLDFMMRNLYKLSPEDRKKIIEINRSKVNS